MIELGSLIGVIYASKYSAGPVEIVVAVINNSPSRIGSADYMIVGVESKR